jgi:hypothetical protein
MLFLGWRLFCKFDDWKGFWVLTYLRVVAVRNRGRAIVTFMESATELACALGVLVEGILAKVGLICLK